MRLHYIQPDDLKFHVVDSIHMNGDVLVFGNIPDQMIAEHLNIYLRARTYHGIKTLF